MGLSCGQDAFAGHGFSRGVERWVVVICCDFNAQCSLWSLSRKSSQLDQANEFACESFVKVCLEPKYGKSCRIVFFHQFGLVPELMR